MIICSLIFTLYAAGNTISKSSKPIIQIQTQENTIAIGNYVSENYVRFKEDYDGFTVSIAHTENNNLKFSVRSRVDLKKQTCT